MFLVLDPYRHTHSAQNGFRLLTHGFVHQRVGVQAAGAGTDEHGGVRHHAHHREIPAEPAFEIADAHPGGDRDHQRVLVLCHRGERGGRGRQRLRFDGEYQDIGARGNGGIVGVDLKPKQLRHAIALRGVGIREHQAATVPAAVDKAAGEGAGYVAGADESDQWRVMGGSGGHGANLNRRPADVK